MDTEKTPPQSSTGWKKEEIEDLGTVTWTRGAVMSSTA